MIRQIVSALVKRHSTLRIQTPNGKAKVKKDLQKMMVKKSKVRRRLKLKQLLNKLQQQMKLSKRSCLKNVPKI